MTRAERRAVKRVRRYWGDACSDYDPGCACCAAWKLLDAHPTRPPSDTEVERLLAEAT